jgi:hypothetical protein
MFSVLAQAKNQTGPKFGLLPSGTYSFWSRAPEVVKVALLTDDDGRHLIARAHTRAKKMYS